MQSFVSVRRTTVVVVVVHLYPMSLIVNKKTECSVVCEMSIYLRLLLQGKALPVDVADNNNNNNKKRKKGKNGNGRTMVVAVRQCVRGRRREQCT